MGDFLDQCWINTERQKRMIKLKVHVHVIKKNNSRFYATKMILLVRPSKVKMTRHMTLKTSDTGIYNHQHTKIKKT